MKNKLKIDFINIVINIIIANNYFIMKLNEHLHKLNMFLFKLMTILNIK